MVWTKIGLIFQPDQNLDWMKSHCQLPVPLCLHGDLYRIYFASRNEKQQSQIGYFDYDLLKNEVIDYSKTPLVQVGGIGSFDEHGVYPSSIVERSGKLYLYYIGWNKGYESPLFYAGIGLAISEDGGKTFAKYSSGPVLCRGIYDPCFVTAPFVFKNPESDGLIMYYVSCFKWQREKAGNLRSFYHIKSCTSIDGITWDRGGKVVIDLKNEHERDISRCSIFKYKDIFQIWYSYNTLNAPYQIGFGESSDLESWTRADHQSGITTSSDYYDDTMNCYPFVFKHSDQVYMLYNGNSFGKEGVILSKLEQE